MIKITMAVSMLIAASTVGWTAQKASAKKTALSESELRAFAKAVPNVKTGGTLYSVAMATSNDVNRQQQLLKASSACLIACGKEDVYKKHAKGKLQNVEEFERNLKDNCKRCVGTGKMDRRCHVCMSVKGKCQRCKGSGKVKSVGFNRPDTWKACGQCNGNGQCRKCGGNGYLKEKCLVCTGTGRVFSADVSTSVFRDLCHAIADSMAVPRNTNSIAKQSPKTSKEMPDARKVEESSAAKLSAQELKQLQAKIKKQLEAECGVLNDDDRFTLALYNRVSYYVKPDDEFLVCSLYDNPGNYYVAMMSFPWETAGRWYASVVKCVEKLKSWILVSQKNKIKNVTKEFPGTAIKTIPEHKKTATGKAEFSPLGEEALKFSGSVSANDSFERYEVSISAICDGYFDSEIFKASGTIDEINKEMIKFLIYVNPDTLLEIHKKKAAERALFQ